MIDLLYSAFIVINSILSATIIDEVYNNVRYTITLGQVLVVTIIVGVVLRLFLPRSGIGGD